MSSFCCTSTILGAHDRPWQMSRHYAITMNFKSNLTILLMWLDIQHHCAVNFNRLDTYFIFMYICMYDVYESSSIMWTITVRYGHCEWCAFWASSWQYKSQLEAMNSIQVFKPQQRKGSIWNNFRDSMRKKTTSTEGTPEGLLEVIYTIRVLRTMKKTETGQRWEARETNEWIQVRRE